MSEESELATAEVTPEQLRAMQEEIRVLRERVDALNTMAHEDPMLGIHNRRGLMREIERMVSRAQRYDESCALLFVDFDGLKQINDAHGHMAGDAALAYVTKMLAEQLRASDVIGRFGGDELCVLLCHVDEQQAADAAKRLSDSVSKADFIYEGRKVPLSLTIGTAMIGTDDDAEAVLARADAAMYAAKN